MTSSYIKNKENAFKHRLQIAEQTASNERQRADATEEILKEIVENNDIEFNKETMKKISSVTTIKGKK